MIDLICLFRLFWGSAAGGTWKLCFPKLVVKEGRFSRLLPDKSMLYSYFEG